MTTRTTATTTSTSTSTSTSSSSGSFRFVFQGEKAMPLRLRHDLSATNNAIETILAAPQHDECTVTILPHGVVAQRTKSDNTIVASSIFDVLLSGANEHFLVCLGRDPTVPERKKGDHTIFVFRETEDGAAMKAAELLNENSKQFLSRLKGVKTNKDETLLKGKLEVEFSTEREQFEQDHGFDADSWEQQAFTGYVEELPTKNGRPSVVYDGEIHEIQRVERRASSDYAGVFFKG